MRVAGRRDATPRHRQALTSAFASSPAKRGRAGRGCDGKETILPAAEDRAPHPHPRRPAGDRDLEIRRHPHRNHPQPVPRGPLGQPLEVRPRILTRRHAHQAGQRRSEPPLARPDERIRLGPRHPGFLRLPCVHLDQQRRSAPSFSIATSIASASRGRSSVSITSAIRTASRALLVCSPPMMCS